MDPSGCRVRSMGWPVVVKICGARPGDGTLSRVRHVVEVPATDEAVSPLGWLRTVPGPLMFRPSIAPLPAPT